MKVGKLIFWAISFGILSVAISVAGTILGILLAFVTPITMIFTGLWTIWFLGKDFDEEDNKDSDDTKAD